MHIHLADFQLLGRDAYDVSGFDPAVGGTRTLLEHEDMGMMRPFVVMPAPVLRFDHGGAHGGHGEGHTG